MGTCFHSSKQSPLESPDCGAITGDPTTCTSSFESVEQFAAPECTSPTATMDPVTPAAFLLCHLRHILTCAEP